MRSGTGTGTINILELEQELEYKYRLWNGIGTRSKIIVGTNITLVPSKLFSVSLQINKVHYKAVPVPSLKLKRTLISHSNDIFQL